MAVINVNRATGALTSVSFLKSAVLIVVGVLVAQVATDFIAENVYDVPFEGGDALYPLVAAFVVMALVPGRYSRPIALGATATSVRVAANQYGVL